MAVNDPTELSSRPERSAVEALKRTRANRKRVGCCRWAPPASASRKESHFDQSGFSPGFKTPRLKPEENGPTRAARLESRASPHKCGGSHHAISTGLTFSRPCGTEI